LAAIAMSAGLGAAASVEGVIRDAHGKPAAATVYLQAKPAGKTITAHADVEGAFSFADLPAGSYTLRAQMNNAGEATAEVVLTGADAKRLDLTLRYAFYDEPGFIVAGMTDTMNRGGHGSDTVLRSAESLAKETASLANASAPAAGQEKQGHALEAVREYQRVAEIDPTEAHLFDWGAELLKHRAFEPATQVFAKGNGLFPRSLRMLLGLAVSWYALGSYGPAAASFFEACDLAPGNPEPYMFLGKVQSNEIIQSDGYVERMKRFAASHPKNAWASYYYAVGLWKRRAGPEDADTPRRVRELLESATRIDAKLGAAYLLLGVVYADAGDFTRAAGAFQKTIEVSPELEEAHYRLGQIYRRLGDKDKARKELETYEQMTTRSAAEAQRERAQIRQFVYELRGFSGH
jgi:tetratricopeptide (TPR) repeat protein